MERLSAVGILEPLSQDDVDETARWQYDPADVKSFVEQYVDSDGAASILEVTRIMVQQWARVGRLPAVTGPHINGSHSYRFPKEAIIWWRNERLTFGEAQALLQVSKATLQRWVKQGKLTPLKGMGGKQRWFARWEVEELVAGSVRK